MDTASLRIKFTPLIKKLHTADSKCCLEIVPEVACLQNFDKIQWKQENNLYEYIIPMTYKIILKKCKKYDRKCMDCKLNQVYHSCVDLLHSSLTSSVDAAGDVNRIFSETVLLNKVPADMHRCDMILSQPIEMNCNVEDKVTVAAQTYEKRDEFTLSVSKNSGCQINDRTISTESETQNCVMHDIDIQVDSFENIMNIVKNFVEKSTQNIQSEKRICFADSDLIVKAAYPISTKSHFDTKRFLSFTPICSINTKDTLIPLHDENSCNPNSLVMYDNKRLNKDLLCYDYFAPINNINTPVTCRHFDDIKHLEPYNHITPEVRIAKFMRLIEDEIFPLKCMLNEIVSKYTALNINKKLLKPQQVNRNEERESQDRQKSNRVIYTVVFDG